MADQQTPSEEEASAQLRSLLDQALRRHEHYEREPWSVPEGTSLASDDARSQPLQVSHAVQALASVADDHLMTLRALFVDANSLPTLAGASLVRGALETAAAGLWILDAETRKQRVTNCLRWHAQDAHDAARFASTLGAGEGSESMALVEETTARAHIELPKRQALRSKTILEGADEAMRRAELAGEGASDYLAMWQAASAFAHGRRWPMLTLSDFEDTPGLQAARLGLRRVTARVDVLLVLTAHAHLMIEQIRRLWTERTAKPVDD
ncbi:MAG: hypothetical protein WA892_06755 [Ornithinimicrobium sp.]